MGGVTRLADNTNVVGVTDFKKGFTARSILATDMDGEMVGGA